MKNTKRAGLNLKSETIRQLASAELSRVEGGGTGICPLTGTCTAECNSVQCTQKCDPPTPTATCNTIG